MRAVIATQLRRVADRLAPAPPARCVDHKLDVEIVCDVEEIIKAIKKRNRRKGLGEAGI